MNNLISKEKKKKMITITIIYLIFGNIIIPLLGYLYTGTVTGALKIYAGSYIISFIFWPYFGYLLINPLDLINKKN